MTSTTTNSPAPQTAIDLPRGSLASGLQRWFDRLAERRQMKMLLGCDDRVLKDIGVSRAEIWARLHGRF